MKSSVSLVGSKLMRRVLRAGVATVACLGVGAAVTTACLDRPVGEQSPRVSNIFVDQIAQSAIDKIDLLFMIDNSVSMQDKQNTLRDALPELVDRLITPVCVNADGVPTGENSDQEGRCPTGSQPEFRPIRDIHIGVISSSLGGYGTNSCVPDGDRVDVSNVDNGRLVATLPRGSSVVDPATARDGFLNWAPDEGGLRDASALKQDFQDLVRAVGERGCGYEASLEAWYRFLIDPEPYATVRVEGPSMVLEGTDTTILEQRAEFLRHDSLVAIIMLSDENDCSVAADNGSQAYYTTLTGNADGGVRAPKATQACDNEPNSRCCRPCAQAESTPPDGCQPLDQDPSCQDSNGGFYKPGEESGTGRDSINLRCFQQRKRFGVDFLWNTDRYVRGLTQTTVPNRAREQVPNPLFVAPEGQAPRRPQLVYLAGIIGVPWQDVATPESIAGDELRYLTYNAMSSRDSNTNRSRWDIILGDVNQHVDPLDPHMRESVEPRSGANPLFPDISIVGPESTNPLANRINGHEADYSTDRRDLQYACIYKLPEPVKDCSQPENQAACDCVPGTATTADELKFNRPLCNPPAGGAAQSRQYFAKAYPGLRQLQVLKDFGAVTTNSIVASICPKYPILSEAPDPAFYGYTPAVAAIIDRLKEAFGGKCLSRQLDIGDDGEIPCKIVETTYLPDRACEANGAPPGGCSEADGRAPVSSKLGEAVRGQLRRGARACGGEGQPACNEYCMCEIKALTDDVARERCENDPEDSTVQALPEKGYCYVDPYPAPVGQSRGSLEAIRTCKETEPRRLRFAGSETPANGSITFIACVGQTGTTGVIPVEGGTTGDGG